MTAGSGHPGSSGTIARTPLVLEGLAGSPGLAIGQALVLDTRRPGVVHRRIVKHHAEAEMGRFDEAVDVAAEGLREVAERLSKSATKAESSILDAYILMVRDEMLREDVQRRILIDHQCAEWAVDGAVREISEQLRSAKDSYLAERSHDIEFIGDRLLRALAGRHGQLSIPELREPSIIIAHDLSPAETAGFKRGMLLGLVTEVGTRTSHTAILARALEIPAVLGVAGLLNHAGTGDQVIADGLRGRVTLAPTGDILASARERARRHDAVSRGLRERKHGPAVTLCGEAIRLHANIELPAEADLVKLHGAEGIGLYRTEFLFVDRSDFPSEEEQYATYRSVVETVAPLPATLRTFDLGGDKFPSALGVPADINPALGMRAVRIGLARPETFMPQLRAMVRASAHGNLRILVPMIAAVHELRVVKQMLGQAIDEIDREGLSRANRVPLGVMIEIPSAAVMADQLAEESDFLSIGTNDLVQYALAVDRSSPELASLASPFHPAVIRLIRAVVHAARDRGREVGVCGAMSNDPLAATLLIGLGLRDLSLECSAVPEVREAIRRITLADAEAVAEASLAASTAEEVEQVIARQFLPLFADLLGD